MGSEQPISLARLTKAPGPWPDSCLARADREACHAHASSPNASSNHAIARPRANSATAVSFALGGNGIGGIGTVTSGGRSNNGGRRHLPLRPAPAQARSQTARSFLNHGPCCGFTRTISSWSNSRCSVYPEGHADAARFDHSVEIDQNQRPRRCARVRHEHAQRQSAYLHCDHSRLAGRGPRLDGRSDLTTYERPVLVRRPHQPVRAPDRADQPTPARAWSTVRLPASRTSDGERLRSKWPYAPGRPVRPVR